MAPVSSTDAQIQELLRSHDEADGTSIPPGDDMVVLENRTLFRLNVRGRDGRRFIVPPLGQRVLPCTWVDRAALAPAEAAGTLTLVEPPKDRAHPDTLLSGLASWAFILGGVAVFMTPGTWRTTFFAAAAVLGVTAVYSAIRSSERFKSIRETLAELPQRLREGAYLLLVFAIVVAVPGVVLFFGSDVPALWEDAQAGNHSATVALIGVGVQELSIVGAASLPVLLYFVFDREKLMTLRQKFIRQVFRLDPGIVSVDDVEARYGNVLSETYGANHDDNRFLPGARSPILLASAVITLGWTIALLDTNLASAKAGVTLTELIAPAPTATTFAFLGAYFFTLNHVIRGYVRGDLRPKTYAQVAARTVGVIVLAFVLERMTVGAGGSSSNAALLVIAFLAGIVPETVLVRVQEISRLAARSARERAALDRIAPTYESEPLTQLDGIDIYDRARLLDEGVTNVEGLAHHDLVDLLLKTRIPCARLVDWTDQAILYIHASTSSLEAGRRAADPSTVAQLRRYGIRTATDLRRAHEEAVKRGEEDAFMAIVPSPDSGPPVLRVMLDAIEQEEWMDNLEYWHARRAMPGTLNVPEMRRDERGRFVGTSSN
jgi:hypothetical protein